MPNKQSEPPACHQLTLLALAFLVGIVAGFGAVVFRAMIALVHHFLFFGKISLLYDATQHTLASPLGWLLVFVPVLGALVVTWLVKNLAPEAKGHGVPEVMHAIYFKQGVIRPMVAGVKAIASAISIGSGGSVGREGPIIQIGAAFGSMLGGLVNIPARQRIILLAAGAGGGIAATFNAPLGGLAFAAELMLVSINARTLLPVAIATVTASNIGRLFFGRHASFAIHSLATPSHLVASIGQLLIYIPFGIVIGILCLAFVRAIYWTEDRFNSLPINDYLRHALGMLMVGIMMVSLMVMAGHYYIQGVGYATIMDVLTQVLLNPWFLILLFAAKFIATCLTLGSGASGGIFSPALFLGATAGAAWGIMMHACFPGLHLSVVTFAVAGMAAMVGGSTGAIFTAIFMVFEMTSDYKTVLPMIITVSVCYALRQCFCRDSIYSMKLSRRGQVIPDSLQSAMVAAQCARDVMSQQFKLSQPSGEQAAQISIKQQAITHFIFVHEDTPLIEVLRSMQQHEVCVALVTPPKLKPNLNAVTGIINEHCLSKNMMCQATLMS